MRNIILSMPSKASAFLKCAGCKDGMLILVSISNSFFPLASAMSLHCLRRRSDHHQVVGKTFSLWRVMSWAVNFHRCIFRLCEPGTRSRGGDEEGSRGADGKQGDQGQNQIQRKIVRAGKKLVLVKGMAGEMKH